MDTADAIYKDLDREQKAFVNKLAEKMLFGIKAKHPKAPMGLPSARLLLFALISYVSKQDV